MKCPVEKKTRRQTGQLILHEKLFRLDVTYLFKDKMNLTATFTYNQGTKKKCSGVNPINY